MYTRPVFLLCFHFPLRPSTFSPFQRQWFRFKALQAEQPIVKSWTMLWKMRFLLPNAAAERRHAQSFNFEFYRKRIHFRMIVSRAWIASSYEKNFPDFPLRLVSNESNVKPEFPNNNNFLEMYVTMDYKKYKNE